MYLCSKDSHAIVSEFLPFQVCFVDIELAMVKRFAWDMSNSDNPYTESLEQGVHFFLFIKSIINKNFYAMIATEGILNVYTCCFCIL